MIFTGRVSLSARRAWIEIIWPVAYDATNHASLSARRAWIEISYAALAGASEIVALRKESVDRNIILAEQLDRTPPSLSARRAWIEIQDAAQHNTDLHGSLSARRAWIEMPAASRPG